ncbi:MAG: transposase [Cyanobacteria bacterium P01_A01_bin.17]
MNRRFELDVSKVYAVDECHTKGEDIYGWGNRQEQRDVEIDNYRASQAYFGALDCVNEQVILKAANTANNELTIEFVKSLQGSSGNAKIVLIWDGASNHRSQEFRDYLGEVNQSDDWQIY